MHSGGESCGNAIFDALVGIREVGVVLGAIETIFGASSQWNQKNEGRRGQLVIYATNDYAIQRLEGMSRTAQSGAGRG